MKKVGTSVSTDYLISSFSVFLVDSYDMHNISTVVPAGN